MPSGTDKPDRHARNHGDRAAPPGRAASRRAEQPGLARNLGRFFGHIKRGFTTPTEPDRLETDRRFEEERRETPRGDVTLRRTIIEEIDLPRDHVERDAASPPNTRSRSTTDDASDQRL
jgi:hypothetical protein